MILGGGNYALYNSKLYRLDGGNGYVNLYSLDVTVYPNILKLAENLLECVYHANVWVEVRGCVALWRGTKEDIVLLDVRPSEDVEILNAKEVDRGVFYADVPKVEVKRIWEERTKISHFPFPDSLNKMVELNIADL